MTGPRNAKLADQIQVILASTIQTKVKDPRLGFVTITEVRLTGDNREATAFYTVLGDDEARASSAAGLESAKGLIRSEVGRLTGVRLTPTLEFVHDAVPETAEHLEAALQALVGAGVTGIRVAGLWAGVDIDPAVGTGREIAEKLLARGVLVKDTHGQTIRIAPPLVVRATELGWAVEQLRLVLAG